MEASARFFFVPMSNYMSLYFKAVAICREADMGRLRQSLRALDTARDALQVYIP